MWFNPGTRRITVVDGDAANGNSQCNPTEELPPNRMTTVRIEVRSQHVEVWLNDELRCTADRSGNRQAFEGVTVYASDPFYEPAAATINNFFIRPLPQIEGCIDPMACNYEPHAVVDDGHCRIPPDGTDCAGNRLVTIGDATYFVRSSLQLARTHRAHAVVDLPTDVSINPNVHLAVHFALPPSLCVCVLGVRGVVVYKLREREGVNVQTSKTCKHVNVSRCCCFST
eukprot:SAG31_NODE_13144_length_890_cov_1.214918_1_plen_227_part_00